MPGAVPVARADERALPGLPGVDDRSDGRRSDSRLVTEEHDSGAHLIVRLERPEARAQGGCSAAPVRLVPDQLDGIGPQTLRDPVRLVPEHHDDRFQSGLEGDADDRLDDRALPQGPQQLRPPRHPRREARRQDDPPGAFRAHGPSPRSERISARIDTAISAGVTAPMSRPIGPRTRRITSSGTPISASASRRRRCVRRPPSSPT